MKLRKSERCAIVITLLFVFLAIGFYLGGRSSAPLTISTQRARDPAPAAVPSPEAEEESAPLTQERVDINTAGKEELMSLSGIGEALAQRIIDYREENGPFESVTDITKVSGIGARKYEAIKDFITVSQREAEK